MNDSFESMIMTKSFRCIPHKLMHHSLIYSEFHIPRLVCAIILYKMLLAECVPVTATFKAAHQNLQYQVSLLNLLISDDNLVLL